MIKWNNLNSRGGTYKQHIERLTQFIHIEGYLIPVIGVEMIPQKRHEIVKIELPHEVIFRF